MRVLVVGGYGFIGRAIVETLAARGHDVVGWGRSAVLGRRIAPAAQWIEGDLGAMADAAAWREALGGIDAIVNASGALQDGTGSNLRQVQQGAIVALIDACIAAGVRHFVQISAVGASSDASTRFMTTKAAADAHLRASSLSWAILRPAVVIGRNAFGGTALLRALAALPVGLTVYGNSPVQCVALDDVAIACADAVEGTAPPNTDRVLAAPEVLSLRQVIALHRRWLGLPPAKAAFDFPAFLAAPLIWLSDLAGWLGWRSPLRSTAMKVMRDGVVADGESGSTLAPLAAILAANPSGVQDRIAARLFLLIPILILALSALWIGSGITGLLQADQAAALIGGGTSTMALVKGCALIDLLLGGAILIRRFARTAAWLMAVMSVAYLAGGTLITPHLWFDPLAPLLKILPACALALVAVAILDRR